MELPEGTVVDRYTVERVLGEGGMAVVYLCKHRQLGTNHALKVLSISSRSIRERLVQEGQVQASLRHPNIVAVTDIVAINGAPGLVMEFIEGPSVDDLLETQTLSYEQVDLLAEGILQGVAYAHDQGLVHRDLKPANIMLAVSGSSLVPKVTDFGLAKLLDVDNKRAATRTGSTMGTPHYMSPEQVSDSKNVDHRTDVFALGAVLYEMLTGQRAFSGDNLLELFSAAAEGRYTPIRQLLPDIPERMESAIQGALVPDRDERIGSVRELLAVWKGEKQVGAAAEPRGPFDAAFLSSVKSISTGPSSVPSTPDPTWNPGEEGVKVESLFSAEPEPPPPEPTRPKRGDAVSSSSMVSGRSLVVGGGALLMGGGAIGVIALVGIGALGLWWANRPSETREITRYTERVAPVPSTAPADDGVADATKPTPEPGVAATPTPAQPSSAAGEPKPGPGPVAVDPVEGDEADVGDEQAEDTDVAEVEDTDAEDAEDTDDLPDEDVVETTAVDPSSIPGLNSEDVGERVAAVADLRKDSSKTALLLQLVRDDKEPKVRREAHQSLAYQARKRRGDLAALTAYFELAVRNETFKTSGLNVRAYSFVGSDLGVIEDYLVRHESDIMDQGKGMEALVRLAERTGQEEAALKVLERVKPHVKGRLATGAHTAAVERLQE